MSRRLVRTFVVVATLVHLSVAVFSSAKIPSWEYLGHGALSQLTVIYAYLSGVGNHYGFFAPGVLSQMRVEYTCLRKANVVAEGRVAAGNSETRFRWHNIVENFWLSQDKPEVRRSQAASLAGKILAQFPTADSVRLTVKAYVLPSMVEYGEGKRPAWEDHYSVTFHRGSG